MLTRKSPAAAGATASANAALRIRAVPQRQSLVETVVEQLTRQVRSGAVPPGSRLPAESELSRRFEVSRTVVREAVARLKAEELVETLPGQGLYVRQPAPGQGVLRLRAPAGDDAAVASELLEFRAGLETHAAGLAAARRSAADLKRLARAFVQLTAKQGAGERGADADLAFHLEIARASHNGYIVQVLEFLSSTMRAAIVSGRDATLRRGDSLAGTHAEHAAIHAAIVAGDAAAAVAAMRAHLEAGARRLLNP
ncbi:MAG: FadR/GntR family transcriptional regulator [Lautropia sp.]